MLEKTGQLPPILAEEKSPRMYSVLLMALLNLLAILTLCTMYLIRHRRRDLVVSYLVINIGVFAVTVALANAEATSAGMGMGLFGVLSIIRLRSTELDQREVAYYFAALALGLLAGIGLQPIGLALVLMSLLLLVMFVIDSGKVMTSMRSQRITVDRAISDEGELSRYLEQQLGYQIGSLNINELDLINDRTVAEIRYKTSQRVATRNEFEKLSLPS
ncbi:MAG: DUF4956 domain-containing protein [Rothia sp. (in: high G+C Gram-positive bacteria)]|nr:DUF4956 domain-containing protein [Rothia sp. (in: high G+C Gram-positive bacteria)]